MLELFVQFRVMPFAPAVAVRLVGAFGTLKVYVWVITGLVCVVAVNNTEYIAMALSVVVFEMAIGPEYKCEPSVGVEPSVVK